MSGRAPVRMALGATLLLSVPTVFQGCGTEDLRYIVRAAYEEARILSRRQPIAELLESDLGAGERRKLELVLAAREFAKRLNLNVGGSYESIAETTENQVVHVVSAAPRDRLQAYTWWFPIVGRVPYRGYFQRETANQLAQDLEEQGYDTYVRRALAFSTLGYFDDPLLSHLLRKDDAALVETILHEMLHSTVYAKGQAAFNESFANFVGHRAALAFFDERGDATNAAVVRARWADALTFASLLNTTIDRLEAAYERGVTESERSALLMSLRNHYEDFEWQTNDYQYWQKGKINNAVLVARRVYFDRLALFEEAKRRFEPNLAQAIAWLTDIARTAGDPYQTLEDLLDTGATPALGRTESE